MSEVFFHFEVLLSCLLHGKTWDFHFTIILLDWPPDPILRLWAWYWYKKSLLRLYKVLRSHLGFLYPTSGPAVKSDWFSCSPAPFIPLCFGLAGALLQRTTACLGGAAHGQPLAHSLPIKAEKIEKITKWPGDPAAEAAGGVHRCTVVLQRRSKSSLFTGHFAALNSDRQHSPPQTSWRRVF